MKICLFERKDVGDLAPQCGRRCHNPSISAVPGDLIAPNHGSWDKVVGIGAAGNFCAWGRLRRHCDGTVVCSERSDRSIREYDVRGLAVKFDQEGCAASDNPVRSQWIVSITVSCRVLICAKIFG
jgi:hypothetical protein